MRSRCGYGNVLTMIYKDVRLAPHPHHPTLLILQLKSKHHDDTLYI